MKRYILALITGVVGLILGAVIVLFFIVGSPRAKPLPGMPVKAPEPGGDPPGTAVVTLDEKFFDALLTTVFRDLGGPTFPLELIHFDSPARELEAGVAYVAVQNECEDRVIIANEGSGVRTQVRFIDGKIVAPLAFSGSKNLLGACIRFSGWAQANITLAFDQPKQTVYGQIDVEGVTLEGAPAAVGGLATVLIQRSINERINPLEILRAPQLSLAMPVKSTNGTLKALVRDVRAEVANGKLVLHISYEFSGERGGV